MLRRYSPWVLILIAPVVALADMPEPAQERPYKVTIKPRAGAAVNRPARASAEPRIHEVDNQQALLEALEKAQGGDTILLAPGSYAGFSFSRKFPDDRPLTIKAARARAAIFNRGQTLYFRGVENVVLEGFELTGMKWEGHWAQGLIHIEGDSRNVTIRNCHVHHAGLDDDCIKVNKARDIHVIDCHLHDPGARKAGNGQQETLDYYDVQGGLIRGNLFTGGTSRQYINAKGGSRDIIIEGNVLLDHFGDAGDEALILGGWAGTVNGDYEGVNIIARNNIISGSKTGAFQVRNVKDAYIYNNLVLDCTGDGLIAVVDGNGPGSRGGTDGLHIFNNIFCNRGGDMPRVLRVAGRLANMQHGHNLYFNGRKTLPRLGGINPKIEKGSIVADPKLQICLIGRCASIVRSLTFAPDSPVLDAGIAPAAESAGVPTDVRETKRPQGKGFDIGPIEIECDLPKPSR